MPRCSICSPPAPTSCRLDEPWMQQHPHDARRYGLKALDRALAGATGTTAVHLCFGYAALVHEKPAGYSFLYGAGRLRRRSKSPSRRRSQSSTSKVLRKLPSKTVILGVIDLADPAIETPQIVAERIRRALDYVPAERLVDRAGLRDEIPAEAGCVRQDQGDGRRRGFGAARTQWRLNE